MKGIAVRTILLFLIGILVVALIVYLVYTTFSGTSLSQQDCRSMMVGWCTTCWTATKNVGAACAANWDAAACQVGPAASQELIDCASDYFGITITATNLCRYYREECANFIPM